MPAKDSSNTAAARQKLVRYLSVGGSRRLSNFGPKEAGATGHTRIVLPLVAILLLFFILLGMWQERKNAGNGRFGDVTTSLAP